MALHGVKCLIAAAMLAPLSASVATATDALSPRGGPTTEIIALAPGVLNNSAMTTLVHCTNFGSVPGRINTAFYNYDGTFVCAQGALSAAVGETISMAVAPVASMSNVVDCGVAGATINQGVAWIAADITQTLKFRCTAQLIAKASNPPASLDRLSLYTSHGAPLSDIIFADGFDP